MKTRVREDSIVVAVRHQASCDLAGEAALLNLKSGVYYGVNAVGARIWALLKEPVRAREICRTIVAEYNVAAADCRRDVLALLERLAEEGLIEVRDGKPG